MTSDAYELAALAMRYVFAGLMILIALRAAKGALTDSRRAARLRHLSPMTGLIGEMVVLEGDQRTRRGMRYPVIREGMIGASRSADVRIRHSTVRRRHAYFQLTEDGVMVRTHAGARLRNGSGEYVRDVTLLDGDMLYIGSVKLLMVLSVPGMPVRERREEDELFHDGDWEEPEQAPPKPRQTPVYRRHGGQRREKWDFDEPPKHKRPQPERDPGWDSDYPGDPMSDDLFPDTKGTQPNESYDLFMDDDDF